MAESIIDEPRGRRRGPPKKSLAEDISLRLVKTRRGSFSATLELPASSEQQTMWHTGEEALDKLLISLEEMARGVEPSSLPTAVIPDIQNLIGIVGDGVTRLTFSGKPKGISHIASFRKKVLVAPAVRTTARRGSISGRLREVDFKDHTAELYDAAGNMARVQFGKDQEEQLRVSANQQVKIAGEIEEDVITKRTTVKVDEISSVHVDAGFWATHELRTLAKAQGIRRLGKKALSPAPFWPIELDPDDFLSPILEVRKSDRNGL